jgi:ectoine hydroxylase-related dioxygenase (phytanoyl-CoA dioxygenase family)
MNPGDVLLFNEVTHHRSVENHSDRVRWSLDVRFLSADSPAAAKTKRGYLCYDAAHPERVPDYATWAAQYDYEGEF